MIHNYTHCIFLSQDIAYQAAQRVLSTPPEDALQVLTDISQNFPLLARSLIRTQVKSDVQREIKENQKVSLKPLRFHGNL